MDVYPSEYVEHNLPLIVLSGLGSQNTIAKTVDPRGISLERGITIGTDSPCLTDDRADKLLNEFLNADATSAPWNGAARKPKGTSTGFKLRAIGRKLTLPVREAEPPVSEFSPPGTPLVPSGQPWVLHSPLSPLSPASNLFPDGIMAPPWISKHQYYVPAALVSFYSFSSDPNRDSLNDNQLKNEINSIREALQKSGCKTRFAVVLLGDPSVASAPDVDERLANIKRSTGLDPKNSLFFLPHNASRVEITTFVQTVLVSLQPSCIEYYRDLTKHSRRKKGRGSIPPPTAPPTRGTSQTLSSQGWGVRYDFKLGVFAEFRQEMDSAGRHYGFALDALLGSDGIFEAIPSWSPRWDELRLLADTIALRSLRCMLWNSQPTSAVQAWSLYRLRMRSVVDRKGKGSTTYGWEAWESRWAKIMAEMVQRSELPVFSIPVTLNGEDPRTSEISLFAPTEKAFPVGERFPPWHQLHHAGYWLHLAAKHAIRRRNMAMEIPEEDRAPPGQSPATQVALRYRTYDTYLVPEPHVEFPIGDNDGFDHCSEIVDLLNEAVNHFFARGQERLVDRLHLQVGLELLSSHRYGSALGVLKPVWEGMTWRKDSWWDLTSKVTWALNESAHHCNDAQLILATEWELLHKDISMRQGRKHDLATCLDQIPADQIPEGGLQWSTSEGEVSSCITITFVFSQETGHVGEPMRAQLVVQSKARHGSTPLTLNNVTISFHGCLDTLKLQHTSGSEPTKPMSAIIDLDLEESNASWAGGANLMLFPGQTKVFAFSLYFRDSGDVKVTSTSIEIKANRFQLLSTTTIPEEVLTPPLWWFQGPNTLRTKRISSEAGTKTHALPKPPKMNIGVPSAIDLLYTDESVVLEIELLNGEDEETEVVLEVRLLGRSRKSLDFSWTTGASSTNIDLPGHQVGRLAKGANHTESIRFTAPDEPSEYTLEIKALYHLISDLETPVSKIVTVDLAFVSPFEASYDFAPRTHPDPWPSYFAIKNQVSQSDEATPDTAYSIVQAWLFTAQIASFAEDTLIIEDVSLVLGSAQGGVTCNISKANHPTEASAIRSREMQGRTFDIITRKEHVEERRASSMDLSLSITWRRSSSSDSGSTLVTSTLHIPRLVLPTSEPRVLLSASYASSKSDETAPSDSKSLIFLEYTIENPTFHFLTFELTMEAAEDFAFSGPKLRALNVLPMSRKSVRYNLLPLLQKPKLIEGAGRKGAKNRKDVAAAAVEETKRNRRFIEPNLLVVDRYFKKTLKVVGCEGCDNDKGKPIIWLD